MRTLVLMRHADAQPSFDVPDRERPLSPAGLAEAASAGAGLRDALPQGFDHVLCSSATRTRQTLAALQVTGSPDVEFMDTLYLCGTNTLLQRIGEIDDSVDTLLAVAHDPTIPGLAARLASGANPARAEQLFAHYPTATWTEFAVDGTWDALARMPYALASLRGVHRPESPASGPH